jgi:hypothetical protein
MHGMDNEGSPKTQVYIVIGDGSEGGYEVRTDIR